MANFNGDKPLYRKPAPIKSGWHYIGDGRSHDPTMGHPEMKGRKWMISQDYHSGKSFKKFEEGIKNK